MWLRAHEICEVMAAAAAAKAALTRGSTQLREIAMSRRTRAAKTVMQIARASALCRPCQRARGRRDRAMIRTTCGSTLEQTHMWAKRKFQYFGNYAGQRRGVWAGHGGGTSRYLVSIERDDSKPKDCVLLRWTAARLRDP